MATLHIEHPISDFGTWAEAFGRFEAQRVSAGVRSQRIQRPFDDPHYIVVDLEFDTVDAARAFQRFLRTTVWGDSSNSPALSGEPITRVLVPAG